MAVACIGNDEFWRECAAWLTRLELIRGDHKTNLQKAVIADLANTLRDGVLLCHLLNKLENGCIDTKDFNQKPAMAQFLCLRNISIFLKTCQEVFGLKEYDLFEPSMLFDLTNFHQVLCTLSKLSLTPKALKTNIIGFSAQVEKTEEEEEIYQSLKSVNPQRPVSNHIDYYDSEHFRKSQDIYQDLCSYRHYGIASQTPLEKRDYVIKELIDTEQNYVDVLNTIKKHYVIPLQNKMMAEQHCLIFSNILTLLEIHTGFKNQLLKLNKTAVRLSNIFMTWRDKFLIYGSFCANLTDATNLLQDICDKNENINQAILTCDKEANNGKFKLRDLLQVPMQRILKYHLLLEKLVDSTDPNHEEYKDLKRAREAMLDVASYINEMARDKDHMNVLKELAKNMVWEHNNQFFIEKCGRLLKDGEIRVKDHCDNKWKTRYIFIFDKCLFLTKQKGVQFLYRTKLDLADFQVDDSTTRALLHPGHRPSFQWHMYKNDHSIVYSMGVKSIEIKEIMVKAIKDALDNIKPYALSITNHKFEMHTFEKPTTCYRCSKYLKGSIYQGYICRECNKNVHKECIHGSGRCGQPPPLPPSPCPEVSGLQNKLWFAGNKDRTEASNILESRRSGTFLVRIRLQNDIDRYALSLKTENGVKHMKICSSPDGTEQKYYLSTSRYFKSLEEMVINYQQVSLKENFERLEDDAKLEFPYRQIKAEAHKQFHSSESSHLSFEVGEIIIIIGKNEYKEGWSKGFSRHGMGYFPSNYVSEKEEITSDAF